MASTKKQSDAAMRAWYRAKEVRCRPYLVRWGNIGILPGFRSHPRRRSSYRPSRLPLTWQQVPREPAPGLLLGSKRLDAKLLNQL